MQERRHERRVVDYEVRCFTQSGEVCLFIYDICVDGCCMDTGNYRASVDEVVHFKLLDSVGVEGRVVWASDRFAGVQFSQELHPAIILHLGYKPVAVSMNEFVPRDRFGRELPTIAGMSRQLQR